MLQNIPLNTRCFIDANIFVYHHIFSPGLSDVCTDFLGRIERRELPGFTSAVAVAEAVHKVMLAEAISLHACHTKGWRIICKAIRN